MPKPPYSNPAPAGIVKVLVVVAVLVLFAGGALVYLMNSQITDMSNTLSGKESEVGGKQQVASQYNATLDLYNKTAARTQFLEASVTPKSFVPTLLSQLQALAAQTRLQVLDIHPGAITSGTSAPSTDGKPAPKQPYDTMDIGLDVTGSYRDTMTFLYDLTTFPKIVSVSGVQFHPNGTTKDLSGQSVPLISTTMHFTAFVFHDSGNAATATAAAAPVSGAGSAASPVTAIPAAAGPVVSTTLANTAVPSSTGVSHQIRLGAPRTPSGPAGLAPSAHPHGEFGVGTL
jgi:Tfp pilus assembly protein PilO